MKHRSLIEEFPSLINDFTVQEHLQDRKNFGNEILQLKGDNLEIQIVRDRSECFFKIKRTDSTEWLDFGIVWRFMTGSKAEPDQSKIFYFLTQCRVDLCEALGRLKGTILQRVEAQELFLAREQLVKIGIMDRSHPLYKEALEAVAKVSGTS